MNYLFSGSNLAFYPEELAQDYIEAGTLPEDTVLVTQEVRDEFNSQPPEGKVLSSGVDGHPVWADAPAIPNEVLLHNELEKISSLYEVDINELNQAYLAAIVSDGPNETIKQTAVRTAITDRKSQYVADKAAARQKYPV